MANRTLIYTTTHALTLEDKESYRLTLNEDGTANLNELPLATRHQWQRYGFTGRGIGHATPDDGERFFNVLLERTNQYFRVREEK